MQDVMTVAVKPRLRGVLHLIGAVVAAIGGLLLVAAAPTALGARAAGMFSACLVLLFGVSAFYHVPTWSPERRRLLRRADHAAIFILIAGSYAPVCLLVLGHGVGPALLRWVWIGALAGIGREFIWPTAPRWVSALPYLVLGWLSVWFMPAIVAGTTPQVITGIVAGGVAYTVGALSYVFKKPNPWPGVFGYHEVFHAFTLVAAGCHFWATALLAMTKA